MVLGLSSRSHAMTPFEHNTAHSYAPAEEPLWDEFDDTKTLNSLLRGEISAAETYDLAISKFEGRSVAMELRRIRDEHHAAMSMLRDRVRSNGGDPADSSGPWGAFASAVTGTAMALGMKPVISALRQGEEHGISEYQKAINSDVTDGCRRLIEGELLPMCRQHVTSLQRLSTNLN
jgi:uncharacterized protein (TIGR02284 family)